MDGGSSLSRGASRAKSPPKATPHGKKRVSLGSDTSSASEEGHSVSPNAPRPADVAGLVSGVLSMRGGEAVDGQLSSKLSQKVRQQAKEIQALNQKLQAAETGAGTGLGARSAAPSLKEHNDLIKQLAQVSKEYRQVTKRLEEEVAASRHAKRDLEHKEREIQQVRKELSNTERNLSDSRTEALRNASRVHEARVDAETSIHEALRSPPVSPERVSPERDAVLRLQRTVKTLQARVDVEREEKESFRARLQAVEASEAEAQTHLATVTHALNQRRSDAWDAASTARTGNATMHYNNLHNTTHLHHTANLHNTTSSLQNATVTAAWGGVGRPLVEELARLDGEKSAAMEHISLLEEQLRAMRDAQKGHDALAKDLTAKAERAMLEAEGAQACVREQERETEVLLARLSEQGELVTSLNRKLALQTTTLTQLQAEATGEIALLSNKLDSMRESERRALDAQTEMSSALTACRESLAEAHAECEHLRMHKMKSESLEAELNGLRHSKESELSQMRARMETQYNELRARLESEKNAIKAKHDAEHSQLKHRLTELTLEVQMAVQDANLERQRASEASQESSQIINEYRRELERLQHELSVVDSERCAGDGKLREVLFTLQQCKDDMTSEAHKAREMGTRNEEMRLGLQRCEAEKSSLKAQLQDVQLRNEELQRACSVSGIEKETVRERLRSSEEECAGLRRQLDRAKQRERDLESDLASERTGRVEFQRENNELGHRIEDLLRARERLESAITPSPPKKYVSTQQPQHHHSRSSAPSEASPPHTHQGYAAERASASPTRSTGFATQKSVTPPLSSVEPRKKSPSPPRNRSEGAYVRGGAQVSKLLPTPPVTPYPPHGGISLPAPPSTGHGAARDDGAVDRRSREPSAPRGADLSSNSSISERLQKIHASFAALRSRQQLASQQ